MIVAAVVAGAWLLCVLVVQRISGARGYDRKLFAVGALLAGPFALAAALSAHKYKVEDVDGPGPEPAALLPAGSADSPADADIAPPIDPHSVVQVPESVRTEPQPDLTPVTEPAAGSERAPEAQLGPAEIAAPEPVETVEESPTPFDDVAQGDNPPAVAGSEANPDHVEGAAEEELPDELRRALELASAQPTAHTFRGVDLGSDDEEAPPPPTGEARYQLPDRPLPAQATPEPKKPKDGKLPLLGRIRRRGSKKPTSPKPQPLALPAPAAPEDYDPHGEPVAPTAPTHGICPSCKADSYPDPYGLCVICAATWPH